MKPGDHPEFFRFPAPEGRSRESTIELDEEGRFHDAGSVVEHRRLEKAMHTWISRHPDDGRYILTNGYDWTYFTVKGTPYAVTAVRDEGGKPVLVLDDETEEPLDPHAVRTEGEHLLVRVKAGAQGGPYDARFARHGRTDLAPWLALDGESPVLRVGDVSVSLE